MHGEGWILSGEMIYKFSTSTAKCGKGMVKKSAGMTYITIVVFKGQAICFLKKERGQTFFASILSRS